MPEGRGFTPHFGKKAEKKTAEIRNKESRALDILLKTAEGEPMMKKELDFALAWGYFLRTEMLMKNTLTKKEVPQDAAINPAELFTKAVLYRRLAK